MLEKDAECAKVDQGILERGKWLPTILLLQTADEGKNSKETGSTRHPFPTKL